MLGSKKKEEAFPVNEALLNVITPMGLEIKRNSLVIGENLGKVYGAVRYPQKVDMGWLSKITNIPSTIVSVGITPIDNGSLISAISKSIVQQRGAADSAKDPLTRQRAEKAAEDGEKIMQRIDQEGETVAMMSLTVMPIAQDEANFTKVCRRVESAFNIQKCKVRTLANLQKEGFQSISPTYPANSTVDSIVSRIIPMSTFVGGFPFASSGYNDGRGYYFAKDSNGGLVILDTWERGNDRTNSSFVIMGVAGIGKSTVVKHIMLSEYMKGTKILCIDPESEYKDMCRNLNGSWLNAGGGKNGRSNLLQIRPAPRDDDDETDKLYTDEGNGMSDMALHMKTLEIEFSLYLPSLTDMQKAILKQTIIELYNQFGIFWETDIRQLKATDFPILSDLHALLEKKAEANKENPVYRDLAMLLYDAAAGSDSFLWNGHTTLEANSRFICLDIGLNIIVQNIQQIKALYEKEWESIIGNCDTLLFLGGGNEPTSLEFIVKLLGKETIATRTRGETKGRSGSSSTNFQQTGRDLMTIDEVRKLDTHKAILFIRGEDPVLDKKYNIKRHPNIKLTTDGKAKPYIHKPLGAPDYALPDLPYAFKSLDDYDFIDVEEPEHELSEKEKDFKPDKTE